LKKRLVFQAWHGKDVVFDFVFRENFQFSLKTKSKTFWVLKCQSKIYYQI
jgi:hypothetical protein